MAASTSLAGRPSFATRANRRSPAGSAGMGRFSACSTGKKTTRSFACGGLGRRFIATGWARRRACQLATTRLLGTAISTRAAFACRPRRNGNTPRAADRPILIGISRGPTKRMPPRPTGRSRRILTALGRCPGPRRRGSLTAHCTARVTRSGPVRRKRFKPRMA